MELDLWQSARNNDCDRVREILGGKNPVDVNWANPADKFHSAALHIACRYGHDDIMRILLRECPDIDVNRRSFYDVTPLQLACHHGKVQVVKLLLKDPRVDVNRGGSDGCGPLWFACFALQREVVKWMIMSGREIDWEKKGEHWDVTYKPAEIAIEEKDAGTAALIRRFLEDPVRTRHQVGVDLAVPEYLAAELFSLVVFFSDDYVTLASPQAASSSSRKSSDLRRFFGIAVNLPMELQMILCNRIYGSLEENIPTKLLEPSLMRIAHLISS
jgi:ankyrin repeat protein